MRSDGKMKIGIWNSMREFMSDSHENRRMQMQKMKFHAQCHAQQAGMTCCQPMTFCQWSVTNKNLNFEACGKPFCNAALETYQQCLLALNVSQKFGKQCKCDGFAQIHRNFCEQSYSEKFVNPESTEHFAEQCCSEKIANP
jgi:hypothetical protein